MYISVLFIEVEDAFQNEEICSNKISIMFYFKYKHLFWSSEHFKYVSHI